MITQQEKLKFLISHVGKYKGKFILPILCMIFLAIITPLTYYLSKIIIDEVLPLHTVQAYKIPLEHASFQWQSLLNMEYLSYLPKLIFNTIFEPWFGAKWYSIFSYIIIPAFFIKGLLTYVRNWLVHNIGHRIICDFQSELYGQFLKLPISYYDTSHSGEISSRIISDVYRIQEIVTDVILSVFQQTLLIIGTVIVLFVISFKLTLISFIGVPAAIAPIVLTGKYLKRKSRKAQEETAIINSHVFETTSSIKVIKLFQKEAHELNRFNKIISRLLNTLLKTSKIANLSSPLVEFLSTFIVALFVGYGCTLIESDQIKPGDFIAFIVLVYSLYDPIKRMSRMNHKVANGSAALERIMETINLEPEKEQGKKEKVVFNQSINFENISFQYGNEPVLQNVSFEAKKGETIAIVGPSGSGKTTLVNLLPAFYTLLNGDIKIDGISLKEYQLKAIRDCISLVSQDVILFNESIKYNISYSNPNADMTAVIDAAQKANAVEFIEELPEKYETMVGERGTRLSGGQRQRISIARALLSDKPILILDEATSALDVKSEKIIQKALEELMKDRTTFVVAHRLSTIKKASKIIVLNQGQIESMGTHEELLTQNGLYKSLYQTFTE